jgi:hypothetical protein
MHENPPGYEVEQPIDLSKPVALAAKEEAGPPRPERHAAARKSKNADDPPRPDPPVPAEPALSGIIAVINLQPGACKTLVAQMLHSVIGTTHANVRLGNGSDRVGSEHLVIADMPSDLSGADWRRQTAAADLLVIPVPDDSQAAHAAQWLLDQLITEGRSELAASAVVAAIQTGRDRRLARRIVRYFRARTAKVVRIKLRRDSVPNDDHTHWKPLAETVLRALQRPAPSGGNAVSPAAGRQHIVPLDVRDYGKAMS